MGGRMNGTGVRDEGRGIKGMVRRVEGRGNFGLCNRG